MATRRKCVNKRALIKFVYETEACSLGMSYLQRKGSFRELWSKCSQGTWMAWVIWVVLGGETHLLNDDFHEALNDFVKDTFYYEDRGSLEFLANTQEIHLTLAAKRPGWNEELANLIREKFPIESVEDIIKEVV